MKELFLTTVQLGIKELLNKEQTGFNELLYHKSTVK